MNTQQFKNIGYISVPYPQDLRQAVVKAVESWKAFCSLPNQVKEGLPYSNKGAGIGYELKLGIGPKADRKENFDATTGGIDWLRVNAQAIKSKEAIAFVEDATTLVQLLSPAVFAFAKELETGFEIKGLADEVRSGGDSFFVRFIHYFGERKVEDETASAHVDQSGFTYHLYESHPGLQCLTLTEPHTWVDMPVSEGETVIIPSMQLQLRSEGKLTALCHRVVATKETAVIGRYSAVCFIQLKHTAKYDKERNGRLQEKNPGFNYGMDHSTFQKYFA